MPEKTAMERYYNHKNGRIYYSDRGQGLPVVLIHGYLENSEVWAGFADRLARKYRVIAVDLPGHGRSDVFGDIHGMDFMAGLIKELLGEADTGPVFMTGHSMGGYVTLAFADLFPDLLKGYCLFHSHPFADSPEIFEKREMDIGMVLSGNKDRIFPDSISRLFAKCNLEKYAGETERLKKIAAAIPERGIIAALRGMMERPSRVEVMEDNNIPCLWLLGGMDNHIDSAEATAKAQLSNKIKIAILKNSGHIGFIEEPERSFTLLDSFISSIQGE